jgi:hypothetical protein
MAKQETPTSGRVTVTPLLRRNPLGPVFFSPVVDIRVTDRDLRILSFIVPAADPEELVQMDDKLVLPIKSQCELVIPEETAEALIRGLTVQLEALRAAKVAAAAAN